MRERLLELGDLIQSITTEDNLGDVVDVLAQTARANADAEPDPEKRQRLRWYATQLLKLRAGPPASVLPRAPRVTGAAAIQLALERLMLRINRMRDTETLRPSEIVWLDLLGDGLTHLVDKLPDHERE